MYKKPFKRPYKKVYAQTSKPRKPIVKAYKDYTLEEKDRMQKMWVKHLNLYCPVVEPKELGCRPCDLGCPCDKCHYDVERMQKPFINDCVKNGIPITPDEFAIYKGEES